MDVKTWTYLIVGITFVAYIGIAIWSKAKVHQGILCGRRWRESHCQRYGHCR